MGLNKKYTQVLATCCSYFEFLASNLFFLNTNILLVWFDANRKDGFFMEQLIIQYLYIKLFVLSMENSSPTATR